MSREIVRKHFQYNTAEGGTSVDFILEHDPIRNVIVATTIQLNSNYNSGLPHNAYIETNPFTREKQLCAKYKVMQRVDGGEEIEVERTEYLDSEIAINIQARIFEYLEDERPTFVE